MAEKTTGDFSTKDRNKFRSSYTTDNAPVADYSTRGNRRTDPGYNRYQNIMDKFAGYEPGEGEEDIALTKAMMAGNLTEKAFDADAAEAMAYTQAGISSSMMNQEANLALRNESEARGQDFDRLVFAYFLYLDYLVRQYFVYLEILVG